MGKNYYCDYCKKSFKDILATRKKHLKGLQHQRAYAEYHAQFKDIREIYHEESKKKTCKRILDGTECKFGSQCRFSHYTKQQLDWMRRKIDTKKPKKQQETKYPDAEWLQRFQQRVKERVIREGCSVKPFWTHPWYSNEALKLPAALPPSMQPLNSNLLRGDSEDTSYN